MAVEVFTGRPEHPIPDSVREKLHRCLDSALDTYAWADGKSVQQNFSWDYGESEGRLRINVDPNLG